MWCGQFKNIATTVNTKPRSNTAWSHPRSPAVTLQGRGIQVSRHTRSHSWEPRRRTPEINQGTRWLFLFFWEMNKMFLCVCESLYLIMRMWSDDPAIIITSLCVIEGTRMKRGNVWRLNESSVWVRMDFVVLCGYCCKKNFISLVVLFICLLKRTCSE